MDSSREMVSVLESKNLSNVTCVVDTVAPGNIADLQRRYGEFDLIVASSVCGFLADYVDTLRSLKELLRGGGTFVQFDWRRADGDMAGSGLTKEAIESALLAAEMTQVSVQKAFSMDDKEEDRQVLVGVARNPSSRAGYGRKSTIAKIEKRRVLAASH